MEDSEDTAGHVRPPSAFSWTYQREWTACRRGGVYKKGCPSSRTNAATLSRLELYLWGTLSMSQFLTCTRSVGSGVFGLKYSPDGSILVAAREDKSIILFDPLSEKVIGTKENAHRDCCNNITFIDDRMFASCSDDQTVAVWDARYLKSAVFSLIGHISWVKNVEYHKPTKFLVSSGFDDQVLSWDLNNPSANSSHRIPSSPVLTARKLIRMRLSPLGDSMYLSCSDSTEIVAIHNLDLESVIEDVEFISCIRAYDCPTIATGHSMIPMDRYFLREKQCRPISRRNHVDFYKSYVTSMQGALGDVGGVCHSIDVHPSNTALLLRYQNESDKITAIHNTCCHYGMEGASSAVNATPPMPRGIATNLELNEPNANRDYIEEVCFSACGRLVASPFGYGTTIATYDEDFNDYEAHMNQRIGSHVRRNEEKSGEKTNHGKTKAQKRGRTSPEDDPFLNIEPRRFHVVKTCFGHKSSVLSTCFSPKHMQLATGSEDGLILIHNPKL